MFLGDLFAFYEDYENENRFFYPSQFLNDKRI
jgi:hypothetical protein